MRSRRARPAFSVPELVLVAVVLVILAAVAFPRVRDRIVGTRHATHLVVTTPPPSVLHPGDTVPLTVRVLDHRGRPVSHANVRFVVGDSSGRVLADSASSDSSGMANARWVLAPRVGRQWLDAQVTARPSVRVRVETTAAQPPDSAAERRDSSSSLPTAHGPIARARVDTPFRHG